MEISRKKTPGKTTTEMRRYQEGLLVAAKYKGMEGTSRGQEYREAKY
jgi:hypothetical protein